jgi:hypothetical protein
MTKKIYNKENPHRDIGKQKFRVRKHYTCWVEYDVVADSKEEAEDAVMDHGGIERVEWQEGYHNDEPVEVYSNDYDWDDQTDRDYVKYRGPLVTKVAECIPYEDHDSIDYDDPNWTSDDYEWKKTGDEEPVKKYETKDGGIPF